MRADRVPASLTPAQGYVGMPCPTCFVDAGWPCVTFGVGPAKRPHAARRRVAEAAAWWHCFGEAT